MDIHCKPMAIRGPHYCGFEGQVEKPGELVTAPTHCHQLTSRCLCLAGPSFAIISYQVLHREAAYPNLARTGYWRQKTDLNAHLSQMKNVRDQRPMRGMVLTEEAKSRIWRIIRKYGLPSEPENRQAPPARDPRVPELDLTSA